MKDDLVIWTIATLAKAKQELSYSLWETEGIKDGIRHEVLGAD